MALDYVMHIRSESARFLEVLRGADPSARVPSCPDWDAEDLLWHLTEVQAFWAQLVELRARARHEVPDVSRPGSPDEIASAFSEWSERLAVALEVTADDVGVWTWTADQSVGFVRRRQAHEALIHRLDAELTTGRVTPLPSDLAADGVREALEVMYGACPRWGTFTPDGRGLVVSCTDTDDSVEVSLGRFTGTDPSDGTTHDEPDISVRRLTHEPDARISGPASDLDSWLWHRRNDRGLSFEGSPEVLDAVRGILRQPID